VLTLSSRVRIFAAVGHVDFRRGIDGLLAIVRDGLGDDAFGSDLFVFFNRRRDRVKILQWDRNGFWLHCKRLEHGVFERIDATSGKRVEIDRAHLSMLLEGIDTKSSKFRKHFARDVRIHARDGNEDAQRAAR
jgi:transposase